MTSVRNRKSKFLALGALTVMVSLLALPVDVLAHGISDADRQRMLSGGFEFRSSTPRS